MKGRERMAVESELDVTVELLNGMAFQGTTPGEHRVGFDAASVNGGQDMGFRLHARRRGGERVHPDIHKRLRRGAHEDDLVPERGQRQPEPLLGICEGAFRAQYRTVRVDRKRRLLDRRLGVIDEQRRLGVASLRRAHRDCADATDIQPRRALRHHLRQRNVERVCGKSEREVRVAQVTALSEEIAETTEPPQREQNHAAPQRGAGQPAMFEAAVEMVEAGEITEVCSVAAILRGKHKPTFTPHLNSGDHGW